MPEMPFAYPTPHAVVEAILEATVLSEEERQRWHEHFCTSFLLWMMEDERARLEELADTPGFTDGEDEAEGVSEQVTLTAGQRWRLGL